jgi:hypothetical protein
LRPETPPAGHFTIQRLARIKDIDARAEPGVLASFYVLDIQRPEPEAPGELLLDVLDFFINRRSLDPDRMTFVSTEAVVPYLAPVEPASPDHFSARPMVEARANPYGSGVFAPEGHPLEIDTASVGIYYPVSEGPAGRQPPYAPEGTVAIAEIGGIGIDRLALAEGKPYPTFEETRLDLLKELEKESESRGNPLPPGYAVFASL